MALATDTFTTIRAEGALLPPDLLRRIADNDPSLDGLTPESYHLSGRRLNEAINQSWNNLQGAWANFKSAREKLADTDPGTSITRERWLLPLFSELGYGRLPTASAIEIDGRSYPISHQYVFDGAKVPAHLVGCNVDLDHRTRGVAGAASSSPHSLVQVFLNRSDENLWGFVANGLRLRVLRDNATLTRQAYLEFDLQAMMDGEVYSDFVLLWLVGHQSRVEGGRDCWLERWAKAAQESGTRALDQLRDGVQAAIEALGVGFLDHPANVGLRDRLYGGALPAQDYYRQLLRMVYRLLVMFVAEDRDLLYDPSAPDEARRRYADHYSTRRLRQIAQRLKGTRHTDLYESLRLVMRLLGGIPDPANAALLGLPVLGSYLFSDPAVADLIDCRIGNGHLLDAVRALAFTHDKAIHVLRAVDYKNIGPEEFGSVYESLLELHPQINVDARTFALTTAAGSERKTTGSYYTPTSLVDALLDSALNPVIAEALKQPDREAALLDLKICDPACGSGHFLIAAARRVARALAQARTGEDEPTPAATRHALRDVIGHCIYGVDINPMAAELCKVNLWMEALEPGKPLSFLDHRIQVGNSLLGTTPKLMAGGIPDDAFTPIEGDDKSVASELKKQNKKDRKDRETGQQRLDYAVEPPADYAALTRTTRFLDDLPDDTLAAIRAKEAHYKALGDDPEYQKARLLADAWCAAFVWHKTKRDTEVPVSIPFNAGVPSLALTDLIYRRMERNPDADEFRAIRPYVVRLAEQYQFFHWHVAFPDVFDVPDDLRHAGNEQTGWNGGFDCVLGNPPWERIKIQEKEWFAERDPAIATAPNAAARKRMIDALIERDPYLYARFQSDLRQAEGESQFVRVSDRYPLCGRGDVNTYTIFAETSRTVIDGRGRLGMIVPSGIATDDTTKFFFQDMMETQTLASLYDFENREGLFPAVDSRMKFCLLTVAGADAPATKGAEFVFFALNTGELLNPEKRFTLSAEDIALLNPNTRTTATFRSRRDAEITKAIYRRVPVLIQEEPLENPWGIRFSTMFHMSNDSGLFRTREQMYAAGFELVGNRFVRDEEVYLPLYEGRMFHFFDHRAVSIIEGGGAIRTAASEDTMPLEHADPTYNVFPRYWVDRKSVYEVQSEVSYLLTFKDVTSATNERTGIFALIPFAAVGHTAPLVFFSDISLTNQCFYANSATFIFDYFVRQKVSGLHLTYNYFKQFPMIPCNTYLPQLVDFVCRLVLELTYTAWDLQAFAQDVGYDGPPFVWDDERRFLMRCELDALYFHLYGIARDDVDYIMETFPIVKRKDEAAHGEYRTKRVILEMFDQMAALPTMAVPAPKGDGDMLVPDVSQWVTWLNPPPADPSVAHPDTRA